MIRAARLPTDLAEIRALVAAASAAAGFPALSEEPLLDLEGGPRRPGLVSDEDGRLSGYVHLLEWGGALVAEVVVPPGDPRALGPLIRRVVEDAGDAWVRLWVKDDPTAAAAGAAGFERRRALVRLERPLPLQVPRVVPAGIRIAVLRRGEDEAAYLLVSNEAYAGHPDSGAWDRELLAERMSRPWFDPTGVFLAWERGRPVGLCWTKLHPEGLGEVYSIAVWPDAAGRGLGKALAAYGFGHLHGRGATRALLYADGSNEEALALYRNLGFEPVRTLWEYGRGGVEG